MTSVSRARPGMRRRAIRRRRRAGVGTVVALAAAVLAVLATAGGGAVLDRHAATSPEALVESLVAVEEALTGVALMPSVTPAVEATWGTVRGDFVGDRLRLERVDGDLAALVERASRGSGPVVAAVDDVARAYRALNEAYRHLEAYEEATLAIITAPADGETSLLVEEARGHAEIGLRLALDALERFAGGYGVLRDADAAVGARGLFEMRYADVERAINGDANAARGLLMVQSSQVMVPVERFGVAGGSRAKSVTYACVDRSYLTERGSDPAPPPIPADGGGTIAYPDCPVTGVGGAPFGANED